MQIILGVQHVAVAVLENDVGHRHLFTVQLICVRITVSPAVIFAIGSVILKRRLDAAKAVFTAISAGF